MQIGASETFIGWKSRKITYVPLWDRMEGAWLWTLIITDNLMLISFTKIKKTRHTMSHTQVHEGASTKGTFEVLHII
jgi:hypothetical protein